MADLSDERDFFRDIAHTVIEFVESKDRDLSISQNKGDGDFSTQVDVGVENLIVAEIQRKFPNDEILAEEGHSETQIPDTRIWIIDPICGTNNLSRDINNYCTNIALADNKQLIASCVIDHSHGEYFWSIGGGKVYINDKLSKPTNTRVDVVIEVDFGATPSVDRQMKEKHNKFVSNMILNTNYYLISLNSSLAFAYTAIDKVDGFLNVYTHPWDIAAAVFLIEQVGGIVSDLKGETWSLSSTGTIAAKNKKIHQELLEAFLDNN